MNSLSKIKQFAVESGLVDIAIASGSAYSDANRLSETLSCISSDLAQIGSFLFLGGEIEEAIVNNQFGTEIVDRLFDIGILRQLSDTTVTLGAFRLRLIGNLVLFAERARHPEVYFGDDSVSFFFYNIPARRVQTTLDLCTGTGVHALAAAAWSQRVVGIDSNATAVAVARANAEMNELSDRVEFIQSDCVEYLETSELEYDIVTFNPPLIPDPGDSTPFLPYVASGGAAGTQLTEAVIDAALARGKCSTVKFIGMFLAKGKNLLLETRLHDLCDNSPWKYSALLTSKHSLAMNSVFSRMMIANAVMYGRGTVETIGEAYQKAFCKMDVDTMYYGVITLNRTGAHNESNVFHIYKESERKSYWFAV